MSQEITIAMLKTTQEILIDLNNALDFVDVDMTRINDLDYLLAAVKANWWTKSYIHIPLSSLYLYEVTELMNVVTSKENVGHQKRRDSVTGKFLPSEDGESFVFCLCLNNDIYWYRDHYNFLLRDFTKVRDTIRANIKAINDKKKSAKPAAKPKPKPAPVTKEDAVTMLSSACTEFNKATEPKRNGLIDLEETSLTSRPPRARIVTHLSDTIL